MASGGEVQNRNEEEAFNFENLNKKELKKEVVNIVIAFDWKQEFNTGKILDLFKNIDLLEGMRRKRHNEALKRKKEGIQKLRES